MPEMRQSETGQEDNPSDIRVYLSQPDGWSAHVKQAWDKEYCFQKSPGEDFFHLIMHGEVYLQHGEEKYCLKCALARGILTRNRLNWQKGGNAG